MVKKTEKKKKIVRSRPKATIDPKVDAFLPKADVIGKMVMSRKITPQGADWLIAALDPFHDRKFPLAGYPDVDCSSTLVSHIDSYMDVSHAAADWHGHMFTLPVLPTTGTKALDFDAVAGYTGTLTNATTAYNLGNVNFFAHNSAIAEDLFPTTNAWAPAGLTTSQLSMDPSVIDGYSRVIGMGIEIIDQTPDLYKGGTITVYRQPQRRCSGTPHIVSAIVGNISDSNPVVSFYRQPPLSAAEAVKLYGSVSWEAKEGAYLAVPINSVEVPMAGYKNELVAFVRTAGSLKSAFAPCTGLTGIATVAPSIAPIIGRQKYTEMDTVGVFFTNMNANSRFRIRVRHYVERAPSVPEEAALQVIATPSAPYDIKALQIYQQLLSNLPIATKVADNASGDWFRGILRTISRFVVPVLDIFGLGQPARTISQTADSVIATLGQALPMIP